MPRFPLAFLLTCSVISIGHAQPKEMQVLQEAVRNVIKNSEPSVACILVSRSERYREFNALLNGPEGKLGGFDARPFLAASVGDPTRRAAIQRLDLANPDAIPESYGSGVVIDASGLILTNFHVVQNATKIYVRLPGKTGSYADIHAADGRSDLAVLKLINPPAELNAPRLGDGAKAQKGDFVIGIANPFAAGFREGGGTATYGIIGNLLMKVPGATTETDRLRTIHQLGTLMQTDLRLNLGCSGGGVFNLEGDLIALTSSTAAIVGGETAGGFAIPLTAGIKRIIDVLRRGEEVEYGFLGVGVDALSPFDRLGAVIDLVSDGTPARRAGLQVGEIITAVGNAPIKTHDDLFLQVGTALAGSEVVITLQNIAGRKRQVPVKLSKFFYPGPVIASNRPADVHGLRVDYSSVILVDSPVPDGVFIRDVSRGSAADANIRNCSNVCAG